MTSGGLTESKQITFADAVEANRAFSPAVKQHLHSTYAHFAGGLAMTGTFAYLFHRTGWSTRIMMSESIDIHYYSSLSLTLLCL